VGYFGIEVLVVLWCFVECDYCGVDGFGDLGLVVEDYLY